MTYTVAPIAFVSATRKSTEDDFWGGQMAEIRLADHIDPSSLQGLEAFSHVEILFLFHAVDPTKLVYGARHPRNNPDWPQVGIFAQRAKGRPNRIGSTICRVSGVERGTLKVLELDAIDGTPVLDIKPVMTEFLPRTTVAQPEWATELMANYWADGAP